MSTLLAFEDAVDIGGGRGRLALEAAQSLWRVDAVLRSAFGRAASINEAWRSPEDADKNAERYQAWLAYQRGGPWAPWAPIGLPAEESIHCRGYAIDTNDTSDAQMRIWNDHGWYWTVFRDGKLAERWHLEYFPDRDNHRYEGAPAGVPENPKEWDEMASKDEILDIVRGEVDRGVAEVNKQAGTGPGALLVMECSELLPGWIFLLGPGYLKNAPNDEGHTYASRTSGKVIKLDAAEMRNMLWSNGLAEFFPSGSTEELANKLLGLTGGALYLASWATPDGEARTIH